MAGEAAEGSGHAGSSAGSGAAVPVGADSILSALAALTDREFAITERFTDKTRQTFALAIGFFTIVQTVAFNSFQAGAIHHLERTWLFALAMAAIGFLFLTAIATAQSERLISVRDLDVDRLLTELEAAYEGDARAPAFLAQDYASVVNSQRKSNEVRRRRYHVTVLTASVSILITTGELISALAFRI